MMETKHFIFAISPTTPTKLHEQVCLALDVYNELVAREKLPKIWAITDYLNTKHATQKSPKKQHRLLRTILGVINLVLGLFLLIPSLLAPSEMLLTLCVGMFAAFVGLWALLQKPSDKKKSKEIPKSLAQSAMSLLEHASHLQANENQIIFSENEVSMITSTDTTHIPYENIYSIIETKDLYLLISFDYATVLQKKDLESKTPQEFADFVISKVKFIPTKEIPYENSSLSNLT